MTMQFCEKCGKILMIQSENGKNIGKCSCGFHKTINPEVSATEKLNQPPKEVELVSEKNEFATFPHKCKKCGYDKAEVIDLGILIGDEAAVTLYKCGKCKNSERKTWGSCHA